jgi:hypothetical protein
MKNMRKSVVMVLATVLIWAWITPATNAVTVTGDGIKLEINNGADDVPATVVKSGQIKPKALQPISHVNYGEEAIRISSLCASSSTNKTRSYWNAMGGLVGVSVATNRLADPAAWYIVPTQQPDGWQWFDAITTTFHSFMGSATLLNSINAGEYGHRLVIHASGKYPVSAYTCAVTCTLTNSLSLTFPVGTNTTTGQEIMFGPNFIGFDSGPNGIPESFYDPSTGLGVAGGDDKVYQNGESPSVVTYDSWDRFGATSAITIQQPSDFASVRRQFATLQSFSATLLRSGEVVSTNTIVEARPQLLIQPDAGKLVRITISGGQGNAMYGLLSSTEVKGTYVPYWVGQTFYTGSPYLVTNDVPTPGKRFFQLIEKAQ